MAFEIRVCAVNAYIICADLGFLFLGVFLQCLVYWCYCQSMKKFASKYLFSFDSSDFLNDIIHPLWKQLGVLKFYFPKATSHLWLMNILQVKTSKKKISKCKCQ